jgi:hypothetical protein
MYSSNLLEKGCYQVFLDVADNMKYEEFVEQVNKYYYAKEPIYFKAIADLEELRKDLIKLDDSKHLIGIVKPFLIKWGRMGRVVGRQGLNWRGLSERLRNSEKDFGNLRKMRFQTIDFQEDDISNSIKNIYQRIDPLEYLGSPTTISKIMHVLNPEIFVMWDIGIRDRYKKKNRSVLGNSEGYLEFLKENQREIRDALNDGRKTTGKDLDEIERELRKEHENKTLAKLIDQYNYQIAHP